MAYFKSLENKFLLLASVAAEVFVVFNGRSSAQHNFMLNMN